MEVIVDGRAWVWFSRIVAAVVLRLPTWMENKSGRLLRESGGSGIGAGS